MDEFSALQARIDSQAAPRIERQPASLAPGCHMHPYQLAGLDWLVQRFHAHTSCILGDEMGLGKTLSAIAFVAHLAEHNLAGGSPLPAHKTTKGPFLVVCPLSVVPNWQAEFARFLPTMRTLVYSGSAEHREQLQADISSSVMAQPSAQRRNPNLPFDVLITSYELVLRDAAFLATIPFGVGIVDEAHRLKNNRSALAESMRAEFATVPHWVLLTGTPFQNTVLELFALLQFVAPALFADANEFRTRFGVLTSLTDAAVAPALVAELQARVRPFLLRRLKGDVDIVLPPKREVVLLAGLSSMQKKYYRLILSKNLVALGAQNARCMTNVVMQLRKCVNHPYLFHCAEPEPFVEGDHIFENAGKFALLDRLLPYLKQRGHRVLLFSTSVQSLDICQDYLAYAGHAFERLDGSVRGEERFARVCGFNAKASPTFVFLLSTRAGGVGLNLTSADTVIFLDSDYNVQMDIQAAARVHRLGQTKPVTVIRLVTRGTIEEIILRRSMHKLQRTQQLVDSARFHGDSSSSASSSSSSSSDSVSVSLSSSTTRPDTTDEEDVAALLGGADSDGYRALLSYGLADIWSSDASTITDADIESMLRDPNATPAQNIAASSLSSSFASVSSSSASAVPASTAASVTRHDASVVMAHSLESSLYYYDGVDQKSASNTSSSSSSLSMEAADQRLMADETSDKLFSDLMAAAAAAAIESHAVGSKRRSMNSSSSSSITTSTAIMSTDDRARLENERAEKRQRLAASAEQRRVAKEARQRAEWQAAGYVSLALPLDDDVDNSESADEADDDNHLDGNRMSDGDVSGSNKSEPHDGLHFVVGDATRPEPTPGYDGGAVILACVDNGGTWGRGGFFGALSALSPLIASAYERAGEFGDLKIGTAHLVDVSAASSVSCSSSSSSSPSSSSSSTSSSLGALYVALLVVQSRPRGGGGPSAVQHDALLRALRAVGRIALARRLSVHSPRLGWGTPGFNWYGTERSLRRMVAVGVPVCVYYFRRRQQQQQPEQHEEGHLDNHKQLVARSESITAPPAPLVVNHDSLFSLSLNAEHAGSVDSAPLVSALDHPRARSAALRDIFGGVEVAVAAPSTCSETEAALVRALRRNLLAHGATVVEAAVAVAALGAAVSPSMVIGSAESRVCVWPRDSATEAELAPLRVRASTIVRPAWVEACVSARWRLECGPYRL